MPLDKRFATSKNFAYALFPFKGARFKKRKALGPFWTQQSDEAMT
jgi:hypothetical protein